MNTVKTFLICCLLFFSCQVIVGQDQKFADSIKKIYKASKNRNSESDLSLLKQIAAKETNPDTVLHFSELLIKKASVDSSLNYLHSGYLQKGNAYQNKGNFHLALEAYLMSLKYAEKTNSIKGLGAVTISIADVYSAMDNSTNAELYYNKGIKILRQTNDSIQLATALLNAGDEFSKNKKFTTALNYFKESSEIFKRKNHLIGTAYNLGNIGMVYAQEGKSEEAKSNISETITILQTMEDYSAITVYLMEMSDIYLKQKDWKTAVSYAKRSLLLSEKYGLKDQISSSNLKLSELYQQKGDSSIAFKYYKSYITYRDSVTNLQTIQQMADLRTNYEVSQKQVEVDLLEKDSLIQQLKNKRQKNIIIATVITLFLLFLIAIGLYNRYKYIHKTNRIIENEKSRSDNLLLNILPEETAHELKNNGKVIAKKFESVSVLFTDFKEFTQYAENLSPEKLVESVDFYFSKFDEIMEKYGLEKIKTVGDAYMCAAGLPYPTADHALKMVQAAMEIAQFVKESKDNNHEENHTRFEIRIGINSGPVVAGVVGTKKFAYDIWGDTVNIASRMESCSEPGRINISESTYQRIKNFYPCEYRGEIEVKNKGKLKMYFVNTIN
jgi:adenylate cyclase